MMILKSANCNEYFKDYNVIYAQSGEKALELLEKKKFI